MKKLYSLVLLLALTFGANAQIVINEVDADQTGTDTEEFIELKWTASTSLNGYVVVLFNGSDDQSYAAYDLDGFSTDSNGFFILATTALAQAGDVDLGSDNAVQNGADAVAVYQDDATSFPNDTPITTTNLIDVLVYGTADPDDTGLLTGFSESTQYDEDLNGLKDVESLQRTDDGLSYDTKTPTFRAENSTATCDLSITSSDGTCDAFTAGVDTYTATFDFVGGGTSVYTVTPSHGSVDAGSDDPDVDATGTITVTGINEGDDVTLTITDAGVCNIMETVTSPTCEPAATLPLFDSFSYADGSLVPNGGWANHSGTAGDMMVTSGQVLVQHGTPSEDANLAFTPVAGTLYYGFDFTVNDPGGPIPGTDNEYFAHFKDAGFGFSARMDIVPPSGGGDFSVGIASDESTADATWATDLTYGVTYRVIVAFDQVNNIAELWIDANSESDTSILGEDRADPGNTIAAFALRQSDSDLNEGILVDNLAITTTFNEALSTNSVTVSTFRVYPNPASGFVNVVSATNSNAINIEVFDILGKQVINTALVDNKLDVSDLNSGVYILKISEGNATITKKLVIE